MNIEDTIDDYIEDTIDNVIDNIVEDVVENTVDNYLHEEVVENYINDYLHDFDNAIYVPIVAENIDNVNTTNISLKKFYELKQNNSNKLKKLPNRTLTEFEEWFWEKYIL